MSMLSAQADELRDAARNIQGNLGRCLYRRKDVDEMQKISGLLFDAGNTIINLRDRLQESYGQVPELGKRKNGGERESYDAGFSNGVKACLQQLYGLIHEGADVDEIQGWIDRQWEEEA